MILEYFILIGAIIFVFLIIAEMTKMFGLGLIAGALFLFTAYWIYGTGLQLDIGQTTYTNSTITNVSTNTTTAMTYAYADFPTTPFIDMTNILAFIFLLSGLYTIVHYSFEISEATR